MASFNNCGNPISSEQQHFENPMPIQPPALGLEMQQLIAAMSAMMTQNAQLLARANQPSPSVPLYNVLPDLSHNISQYDGLTGAANAKIWLTQLETTANLHRWTEGIAFETARSPSGQKLVFSQPRQYQRLANIS